MTDEKEQRRRRKRRKMGGRKNVRQTNIIDKVLCVAAEAIDSFSISSEFAFEEIVV